MNAATDAAGKVARRIGRFNKQYVVCQRSTGCAALMGIAIPRSGRSCRQRTTTACSMAINSSPQRRKH
jgi:hypothetical protein